ncbi:MAG: hypothetical protein Q9201_006381, partial [Fulgogasparrea decipioides]
VERSVFLRHPIDEEQQGLDPFQRQLGRTKYWERLYNMFWFPRVRRAAIAAMVVMLSQQLSGINTFAFLATQFYSTAGPAKKADSSAEAAHQNETDSFKFSIGFGATNMLFSTVAYFLVENEDPKPDDPESIHEKDAIPSSEDICPNNPETANQRSTSSSDSSISSINEGDYYDTGSGHWFRGRRFLLLTSLGSGVFTSLLTSTMFNLKDGNPARLPMIIFFIIVFTAFYSPGAGAIPFLYSAEIWPNEGREHVLVDILELLSGFNALAFILVRCPSLSSFSNHCLHPHPFKLYAGNNTLQVWFFVPSTNHTATLEDMSYIFGRKLREHALAQAKRLWPTSKVRGPRIEWLTASREDRTTSLATQNEAVKDEPTGQADDSTGTSNKTPALTTKMAQTSKSDDEITEVAK